MRTTFFSRNQFFPANFKWSASTKILIVDHPEKDIHFTWKTFIVKAINYFTIWSNKNVELQDFFTHSKLEKKLSLFGRIGKTSSRATFKAISQSQPCKLAKIWNYLKLGVMWAVLGVMTAMKLAFNDIGDFVSCSWRLPIIWLLLCVSEQDVLTLDVMEFLCVVKM